MLVNGKVIKEGKLEDGMSTCRYAPDAYKEQCRTSRHRYINIYFVNLSG